MKTYRDYSLEFFASEEWQRLRRQVFYHYGKQCMRCGTIGDFENPLQVDHIVPRIIDLTLEAEFQNLQVLCKQCNEWKSGRIRDYRESCKSLRRHDGFRGFGEIFMNLVPLLKETYGSE